MPRLSVDYGQVRQLSATYSVTIPDEYLDAMGHMNVMWYTHLFSMGISSALQQAGLLWEKVSGGHGGTFVLESHMRYLSEIRVGQTAEVFPRLLARSEKRYHVMQFMTNRTKRDISATQEAVIAYVDLRTRRMAPMPKEAQQVLDGLIEVHRQLQWEAPLSGILRP